MVTPPRYFASGIIARIQELDAGAAGLAPSPNLSVNQTNQVLNRTCPPCALSGVEIVCARDGCDLHRAGYAM